MKPAQSFDSNPNSKSRPGFAGRICRDSAQASASQCPASGRPSKIRELGGVRKKRHLMTGHRALPAPLGVFADGGQGVGQGAPEVEEAGSGELRPRRRWRSGRLVAVAQPGLAVRDQRPDEDLLGGSLAAAATGAVQPLPVGGPVAGTAEARRVHECLHQPRPVAVVKLPVGRQATQQN